MIVFTSLILFGQHIFAAAFAAACWFPRLDSNQRVTGSKPVVLPLDDLGVWYSRRDSNPYGCPPDSKSGASANSATGVFLEPATGFEPVIRCLQSSRAAVAPHRL